MLDTLIKDCVKEFKGLLKSKKYVSFKEYNDYLKKYSDVFNSIAKFEKNEKLIYIANNGYKDIEEHNEKYIKNKLKENKKYFDGMFKNVDPNIHLDDEQRKAIINEENYSLIIAGAGAGKTTTMAAKVKYLIEKCNVDPDKIVVISYTNKATEELEDRIIYEFKLPVHIMTFHSLGINLIRKIFDQPLIPVSPKEQEEIIINFVRNYLFNDKELLTKYINTFNKYSDFNNSKMFSKGFVNNYYKFSNFDDYFNDYKKRKYEENKSKIKEIIDYKIESYLKQSKPKTIKNETVKSKAEAKIANYLFQNGIDYEYEEPYPEKVDEEKTYRPDFTIMVNDIPIYIEYYGLSTYYENGTLSKNKYLKYNSIRKKKDEFHRINKTNYIALDYKEIVNGKPIDYLKELEDGLIKYNVPMKKRSSKEIYEQILDNNVQSEFYKFVDYIISLINEIKTSRNRDNYKMILNDYIYNSTLSDYAKYEMIEEVNLFDKIYEYYKKQLIPKDRIDFSDMIYYANKHLNNLGKNQNELEYEYIIIDEYQDISFDRYEFAKNISLLSSAKVVSVGDDWQTIYSFAGSRIDLFYKYDELFPGAKQLFINSTYRNSQQLIDKAGSFIMKNPFQIKKNLRSIKNRENPVKICYYNNDQFELVGKIIERIYLNNPNDKVLILARKNKTIDLLLNNENFESGIDTRIIYKKYPNLIIDAMSVHSSKGLGADQVILLNVTNKDFPCSQYKEIWLKEIFKPKTFAEDYPYAEDRRVFYVALTRTKKDIYLMVPKNENNRSPFIEEII